MSLYFAHMCLLAWRTNVVSRSFQLYYTKKSFSIFWMSNLEPSVKHLPKICWKNTPIYFVKIVEHIISTNHQLFAYRSFTLASHGKDKFWPIPLEFANFELQVLRNLLMIFFKIHFYIQKSLFHIFLKFLSETLQVLWVLLDSIWNYE